MQTTTKTFPFNSRETYLLWRQEWKAKYAELSAAIRRRKKWEVVHGQNIHLPELRRVSLYKILTKRTKEDWSLWHRELRAINEKLPWREVRWSLQFVAYNMLANLKQAKAEAGRQREESKLK